MTSSRIAAVAVVLALTVWLGDGVPAHAGVYRGAAGYNPYTGRTGTVSQGYNPYTGASGTRATTHNPYTGRSTSTGVYHNPYTGNTGAVRATANPYTGRASVRVRR